MNEQTPTLELNVGLGIYGDGDTPKSLRVGYQGDLLISHLNPRYLEHMLRGEVFLYPTAAAGVLAKALDTTPTMMIWNPTDSGRLFVPLKVRVGAVSGSVIVSHLAYGVCLNMGNQIGTTAPVVSQTQIAPTNALQGAGKVSKMRFGTTQTLTPTPTYLGPSGFQAGGTLANGPLFKVDDDLDGLLGFPPGSAFFPFCSNGAMALTAAVLVIGLELPMPSYAN